MDSKWKLPRTKRDIYRDFGTLERFEAHKLCTFDALDGTDCNDTNFLHRDQRKAQKNPSKDEKQILCSASDYSNQNKEEGGSFSQGIQPLAEVCRSKSNADIQDGFHFDGSINNNKHQVSFYDLTQDGDSKFPKGDGGSFSAPEQLCLMQHYETESAGYKEKQPSFKGKFIPENTARQAIVRPSDGRDEVDYELWKPSFTYFDILIYTISIGSYIADVGSDCWLAYMYYTGIYHLSKLILFYEPLFVEWHDKEV